MNIQWIGSPNKTIGRQGQKITGVVIHWIAGNLASADSTFQNTIRNTSAHYGIEDTTVHQYVEDGSTAYHCGNWTVNTQTIGIEHSAQPGRDASQATLDTSAQLIADLSVKHGFLINSSTIRPHSAIKATQCLPLDNTELLTPRGWVPLGDVAVGDTVAQWDSNTEEISFVDVSETVEPYSATVTKKRKLEATGDHRVFYKYGRGKWKEEKYADLLARKGMVYLPVSGNFSTAGLDMDNEYLALLAWIQADGHYMYDTKKDGSRGYYGIDFHLKKQRKVSVILALCESLSIPVKLGYRSDGTVAIRLYGAEHVANAEKWLNDKKLGWELLGMNQDQFDIFIDNLLQADGCVANTSYSSNQKQNIDVLQALLALNGRTGHIYSGGLVDRLFFQAKSHTISAAHTTTEREAVVGCVTVPSGAILVRQSGQVLITGNCPGTINVAWLIQRANELTGRPSQPAPQPSIPSPAVSLETVTVASNCNVRSRPDTSATITSTLKKGDTFKIVGRVTGQMVNGISTWVKSWKGNYVWSGALVGETSPPSAKSGTARVTKVMNVRKQPNTSALITSKLQPGDTFKYVAVVSGQSVNNNNQWVRSAKGNYVHSSGVQL